jgi:hypothetical protein
MTRDDQRTGPSSEHPADRFAKERRHGGEWASAARGHAPTHQGLPDEIPRGLGTPSRSTGFEHGTLAWLAAVERNRPTSENQAAEIDQSLVRRVRYKAL